MLSWYLPDSYLVLIWYLSGTYLVNSGISPDMYQVPIQKLCCIMKQLVTLYLQSVCCKYTWWVHMFMFISEAQTSLSHTHFLTPCRIMILLIAVIICNTLPKIWAFLWRYQVHMCSPGRKGWGKQAKKKKIKDTERKRTH